MTGQTGNDKKVTFANVHDLADYLEISDRRLRQYKQTGRLHYTTDAVLVDRKELSTLKQNLAAYQLALYVPHRFRARHGNRKSFKHFGQEGERGTRIFRIVCQIGMLLLPRKRELEKRTPVEPSCNQSSEGRIQELKRSYGLSREEALEVMYEEARRREIHRRQCRPQHNR
jgi:hypothetical protein